LRQLVAAALAKFVAVLKISGCVSVFHGIKPSIYKK
jgi:hypothetical protein